MKEKSKTEVSFLDTKVHRESGRLWTDLFCKDADSHNYLDYTSAHPKHCKNSLSYSQLLRLKRICSYKRDFLKDSVMLLAHSRHRGYPLETLQLAMDKVKNLNRMDVLADYKQEEETPPDKEKENIVSLLTTYTPQCDDLAKLVKKNWGIVQRSSTTKQLAKARLVVGYRRPKNLRDQLVRARLPRCEQSEDKDIFSKMKNQCKTKNCRYCDILDKSGKIISHITGREYKCKCNVTCKSSNLIYCVSCISCGMHYVGQTKLRLMNRFGNHFTSISRNDGKCHVETCGSMHILFTR